jgi:SAM-dependent MidA family methyltransferase
VREFKKDSQGANHLSIYEVGGGNGTLMTNIMDYIQKEEPDLYKTTQYTIIEISSALAKIQNSLQIDRIPSSLNRHFDNLRVVNKSIFDWDEVEPNPCYFIAMEVLVCCKFISFFILSRF